MNLRVSGVVLIVSLVATCLVPGVGAQPAASAPASPIFKESKIKNYIPHMSWKEVEEALQRTDMVILPVGSTEQHGKHLPLGTDLYGAVEICKLIAQRTDVLVAPSVFAGISEHHMGFPGTITLSPETFEAVVLDTARSLIRHGVRRILIYNGHGGNTTSVANIIQTINQTTPATAVDLGAIELPKDTTQEEIPYDWHAGEGETSGMLYLAPSLVDMSQAEEPVLTLPPIAEKAKVRLESDPSLQMVVTASLFRPKDTGKQSSTKEMTVTGVFTTGDPKNGTAEKGRKETERFVEAAVRFIEAWKAVTQ